MVDNATVKLLLETGTCTSVGVRRVCGFCPLTSNHGILVYRIDLLSVCAYRRCCIKVKRHFTTTQRPAAHTHWKYVTY